MKIALVKYASIDIESNLRFSISLSEELETFFEKRNYGEDVKEIIIGIICVSKNFEPFFNPRKPRYIKGKRIIKSKYTKQEYEIEKCFEYDIKLDFETFKKVTEAEAKKILVEEILKSLSVLDEFNSKIKNFDTTNFKNDLKHFFKNS